MGQSVIEWYLSGKEWDYSNFMKLQKKKYRVTTGAGSYEFVAYVSFTKLREKVLIKNSLKHNISNYRLQTKD